MARRPILHPEEAKTEGARRLRELALQRSYGALAKSARCDETSIRRYANELVTPGPEIRMRLRETLGIPEVAWVSKADPYGREPATTKRGSG